MYRRLTQCMANMAVHDYILLFFHGYCWTRATLAKTGHDATLAQSFAAALFSITFLAIVLKRAELLPLGSGRELLYRLGTYVPLPLSYFELRWLQSALRHRLLDYELMAIDEWLWGTTPSVWLARFNEPAIIEWFSFFYYAYFWLLMSFTIPILLFDKGKRKNEGLLGAILVAVLGHTLYTLVPCNG